jgi:hypothetical protein
MAEKGYFLITDVTGYTAFMTGSELEHAQDILKSLFNALIDSIKPPLHISNFQGDAILAYIPEETFQRGQILLETIESIYSGFMRQREVMEYNRSCSCCNACSNLSLLDLKIFIHYGEYMLQDMRGKLELSGPDVIIAHRMMKNRVKEELGLQAYALFSAAALQALGLEDFTHELKQHHESYEHLGKVEMYAYDLKAMWEQRRDHHRVIVDPETAWFTVDADIPAPPSVVWDHLTTPSSRHRALGVNTVILSGTKNGLTGVGSTYHCSRNVDQSMDFTVLDWLPFDYYTEQVNGLPMKLVGTCTTHLTPNENGTHLRLCFAPVTTSNPITGALNYLLSPIIRRELTRDYAHFFKNLREQVVSTQTTLMAGAAS